MNDEKIWRERTAEEEIVSALSNDLGISKILAKLLVNRNIRSVHDARQFLEPSLKTLKEPHSFKDMEKAVPRIVAAVLSGEQIGIFGDYDVDGVCATAVLQQFFESIGAHVSVTLPNRMSEGYGLSRAGVDRLKERGASLLITADCGIVAHREIAYAKSIGFDVIVVDHHTVGETLPDALAVINPKRPDCSSQAPFLCAAGVAFFLALSVRRALREQGYFTERSEPDVRELLDLVALATVCDVVPLVEDNRALVKTGLRVIKQGRRLGLSVLMDVARIDREKISSTNLGFHLGPRINAAGRLDDATVGLTLMACHDEALARNLATELDSFNSERRDIEEETVAEAVLMVSDDPALKAAPVLVLHHEAWHPGVVGIVASRIAERFHRPAIIIGEKGKGSGRSIKGVDLFLMVSQACETLAGFGGHAHAIGVTLGPLGVETFRSDLLAVFARDVPAHVYQKIHTYDVVVNAGDADLRLIDELARLEPFGAQNPYPVFRINDCHLRNLRRLNGGHIKGELETSDGALSFIGFRMDISDELAGEKLDVLGCLERNEWQGRVSVQMRLIDYAKSKSPS